jgi:hypothetical protein
LGARDRARLAADIISGQVTIQNLTISQIARLCRVCVPYIEDARRQPSACDQLVQAGTPSAAQSTEAIMPDSSADTPVKGLDILETMKAEIAEAVEMMRPHFPGFDEDSLRRRAESLRAQKYRDGRWPDFAEMARKETEDAAKVIAAGIAARRSRSDGQVTPIDCTSVGSTIEFAEAVCNVLGKLGDDDLDRAETAALAATIIAEHQRILLARPAKPMRF